ncbi:follicle cell protein 3C-1 [Chrysoperla carnea]|uniref:follicle cell protein 3C-1 n=1 Tax=Chrysoperla carnea TaxID=189513 RepID=UPI001D08F0D1|nr:follicle cell protein 3C-1 [Chrysoperla carnea]
MDLQLWLLICVTNLLIGITVTSNIDNKITDTESVSPQPVTPPPLIPCTCAVFLSGQFTKGSPEQPRGYPALVHEQEMTFACTNLGNKQCTNKCLDIIVKHLPNSANILCGAIDRDCHKERAYLFIKNCNDTWVNTNLSAGREYCCKDGLPYKCPLYS